MKASVLICTRNRCANAVATARALRDLAIPDGLDVEFLFVDNGSDDGTADQLSRELPSLKSARCIQEPRRGKSNALNTGLAQSDGEIVVLTDDDVRPDGNWINLLCRDLADGRSDAVAGTVRIAQHLRRPWMKATHKAWLACTDSLDPVNPATAVGANMAFHRRVLKKIPGFDVELGPGRLGLWEDTLFSMQIRDAGYHLSRAADSVVEHWFDASRLLRGSFLDYVRMEARSAAYVAWHWMGTLEVPRASRVMRHRLELAAKRALRFSEWRQVEGAPEWELFLLSAIHHAEFVPVVMASEPRGRRRNAPMN